MKEKRSVSSQTSLPLAPAQHGVAASWAQTSAACCLPGEERTSLRAALWFAFQCLGATKPQAASLNQATGGGVGVARGCSRKNRANSRDASGPAGSV